MAARTYEINVRITVDDDVSADSLIDRMMYGLDGWAVSYKEVTEPEPLEADDWINPVTGHSGDCGCVSCHMSQGN